MTSEQAALAGPAPVMRILLASPRGFCAGVLRAVQIVEEALARFGPPVYVRHEIVHNRHVVEGLRAKGAVFVEELAEVPEGSRVIFSAHGVSRAVTGEARARRLRPLDATCPLVSKVHNEVRRHHAAGRHVILVGHANHPEVAGTMGQVAAGACTLVESEADARAVAPPAGELGLATQTTLSVEETGEIIRILQARFPGILLPRSEDICYATTNRQRAVWSLAGSCDVFVVIGASNSSNSRRLAETARRAGCRRVFLIAGPEEIDWGSVEAARVVGLTAGASAPEALVSAALSAFAERFAIEVEERVSAEETMAFRLPPELRD